METEIPAGMYEEASNARSHARTHTHTRTHARTL